MVTGTQTGETPRFVIDASGGVHVLYHDTFIDSLHYAYKPPGGALFADTVVTGTETGDASQFVVDAAGGVHVLYQRTFIDSLDYAYKLPGGSVFAETVVTSSEVGPYPQLIVDAAGGVHALYQEMFIKQLVYCVRSSREGLFRRPPSSAARPAHTRSSRSARAAACTRSTSTRLFGDLEYAYKPTGGVFTKTTVDSSAGDTESQLVLDAAGGLHALYHDTFFDDLDYAYRCP